MTQFIKINDFGATSRPTRSQKYGTLVRNVEVIRDNKNRMARVAGDLLTAIDWITCYGSLTRPDPAGKPGQ